MCADNRGILDDSVEAEEMSWEGGACRAGGGACWAGGGACGAGGGAKPYLFPLNWRI